MSLKSRSLLWFTLDTRDASSGMAERDLGPLTSTTRRHSITCESTWHSITGDHLLDCQPESPPLSPTKPTQHETPDVDENTNEQRSSDVNEAKGAVNHNELDLHESDSSRIAREYRQTTGIQVSPMKSRSLSSISRATGTIDQDKASCRSPTMCCPRVEGEGAFQDGGETLCSGRDAHQLRDMLCEVEPVTINNSEVNYNGDQDILIAFQSDPANIVIESPCPESAPHIVITPPQETLSSLCIAQNNRIGIQCLPQLVVLPFYGWTSRLPTQEEWMAMYYPPAPVVVVYQPFEGAVHPAVPRKVFSAVKFQYWIERTGSERLIMYHVSKALQRHQVKAAAFAASFTAHSFRIRYDIPGFMEALEPPYRWIEPGQGYVESFADCPLTSIVYTSTNPYRVPHIIAHDVPPQDTCLSLLNATPPQDCGAGNALIVQHERVHYHNLPSWNNEVVYSPNNYYTHQEDDSSDDQEDDCSIDTSSDWDSPVSETHEHLLERNRFYLHHVEEDDEDGDGFPYGNYADVPEEEQSGYPDELCATTFPPAPKARFFIQEDDDEEDGLPSLDEWYISMAQRCMSPEAASAVVAAAAIRNQ
ncbi:hypothetical protein B0H34DRAFT_671377 [Crassisporium funariophilum]|nr:hypothetical protein B0H34DRAFT_671377 [Crassisporium funariophilum]